MHCLHTMFPFLNAISIDDIEGKLSYSHFMLDFPDLWIGSIVTCLFQKCLDLFSFCRTNQPKNNEALWILQFLLLEVAVSMPKVIWKVPDGVGHQTTFFQGSLIQAHKNSIASNCESENSTTRNFKRFFYFQVKRHTYYQFSSSSFHISFW